jgi:hypothetical protein
MSANANEINKGNEGVTVGVDKGKSAPEPRDDFAPATVEELAWRAGLRCSVPGCNVLCFGPAAESDKKFNQGTAAHIVSASPSKGPRADATLTSAERKSIANGIWCCARHGRLIDSDEKRYPANLLRQWKREQEERTLIEATQGLCGKGGVISVSIGNLERFKALQTIRFGHRTMILGENGTGRHVFCDMVAALGDYKFALRWSESGSRSGARVEIEALSGGRVKWQLLYGEGLTCNVDGNPLPVVYSGFRVFNVTKQFILPKVEFPDGVDYDDDADEAEKARYREARKAHRDAKNTALLGAMAEVTGLPRDGLLTALKLMALTQGRFFASVRFDGDVLQGKSYGGDFFDFEQLSSSEQDFVLVDLYLRLAEYCARYTPTILILGQHAFSTLDDHNLPRLLETIAKADFSFQVVVSLFRWPREMDFDSWTIWQLEEASDGDGSVVAKQLPFGVAETGWCAEK